YDHRGTSAYEDAERQASGAANSRSDVGAKAVGGRLHADVRLGRGAAGPAQAGPVQSNGICLLDLPAQSHWNPGALTKFAVVLPQVHTCPGPVSDPGGLTSWTRAPGGVVGPVRASAAARTFPGISARQ